ncbi:MAG: VapC toxin protein [uncultured Rubrobacteraceae bacterium]|uniref:Ribonuclease VapC n=1 Tax=uncultured Rubrobacteraceae bacterium TaxID=349277 RepID=A0A6J4NMV3_9ACTN|nr:MAG: VapC toxin protein [uncultured Rubrobacteraceae bacterium]
MLDTNVCIHVIRRRPPKVLRRFDKYEVGEIGVSSVTAAELRYGAEKSAVPEQNREALSAFLLPLEVLAFGDEAAAAYGRVRATLEKAGTPIGPLDTLIAAHAVGLGVTLVTNNTREFSRVPGLELEDWTREGGTA